MLIAWLFDQVHAETAWVVLFQLGSILCRTTRAGLACVAGALQWLAR